MVDDDQQVLYTAKLILKHQFVTVRTESSPSQIRPLLEKESFDVVLLDMNFAPGQTSGKEGLFWLKTVRETSPDTKVVMQTAYGDINLAVEAMKEGATDFLVKPWDKEKLLATVTTVFELSKSTRQVKQLQTRQQALVEALDGGGEEIVSQSPTMKSVLQAIERVAPTDADVLLLGENGTGKDLLARRIHRLSGRAGEAFIKVDLGSITPTLFESELFGHVRGAFTDAKDHRVGRFELASGGTLFLDEIGNLSLPQQAKLLTVLQSRQVTKVGSHQSIPLDIRLVSATNQPLNRMVREGGFRQDLLYRINTVEITLPPLRERREDIPLLIEHFLRTFSKKYGKSGLTLTPATLRQLQEYSWPGNVRQLQHAAERAVILGSKLQLGIEDFLGSTRVGTELPEPDKFHLQSVEKQAIAEAIRKHRGNLSKAALELGLGRSTLYRKMSKYGLQP